MDPGQASHLRGQMVATLRLLGITDEAVLRVMASVPRHLFVPAQHESRAYQDSPLPIGHGQTISQPYIVALMTQSLELTGSEKVLEIGTGCGYQTAILASLASEVVTVERIAELQASAQRRLRGLGYGNVRSRVGDGSLGCADEAPFDRILSAAASPTVPQAWRDQLADGGQLVAPIGARDGQTLTRYRKVEGRLTAESICGCVFVPLIGEAGWDAVR